MVRGWTRNRTDSIPLGWIKIGTDLYVGTVSGYLLNGFWVYYHPLSTAFCLGSTKYLSLLLKYFLRPTRVYHDTNVVNHLGTLLPHVVLTVYLMASDSSQYLYLFWRQVRFDPYHLVRFRYWRVLFQYIFRYSINCVVWQCPKSIMCIKSQENQKKKM